MKKVLVVLLLTILFVSCYPAKVARDLVVDTVNSDDIIYNYQWFKDQYNSIQAQKMNLTAVEKGSQEYSGMKMILNRNIAEYNSRASQLTRNLWKDGELPRTIRMEE